MQIVLDTADFRRLSPAAQAELLALLDRAPKGRPATANTMANATGSAPGSERLRWREPYALNEDEARLLVGGLSEKHRQRLALFASKTGRVRMREIMAVGSDQDLKPSSAFAKEMTRRLRRLINDPEKKAQLIQWDFDSTRWDAGRTTIVDGIYYVAPATAHALRLALRHDAGRGN